MDEDEELADDATGLAGRLPLADFGEAGAASPPDTWQVLGCVWGGAQKPFLIVKELETGCHCSIASGFCQVSPAQLPKRAARGLLLGGPHTALAKFVWL